MPEASGAPGPMARGAGEAEDARLLRRARLRLALWSGGATLVVLLVLGGLLLVAAGDAVGRAGSEALRERVELVERFIATSEGGSGLPPLELDFGGRGSGTFAFLVPDGSDPLRPQAIDPPTDPSAAGIAAARTYGRDERTETRDGVVWRFLTVAGREQLRIAGIPAGVPYLIQVVADRTGEQQARDSLARALAIGALLALVAATAAGLVYADRALVPLRAALADRRAALRRQREFAADASHELRTPLATIRAGIDLVRRHRGTDADAHPALAEIDAEAAHLGRLVDDLLLLARADSGGLTIDPAPVELGDLAAEVAGAFAAAAGARAVALLVDPVPVVVRADPGRIRQVVTILADNALRHAPAGTDVLIRVRPIAGGARLTVRDHGPGIRPEDLPRVFDRFWRASGGDPDGPGLGLAIAAAIVTAHGGRIGAANAPDGGALFTVELVTSA
ncbi:MAG: sensor histidine kinase [Chloroflexota bacterium]